MCIRDSCYALTTAAEQVEYRHDTRPFLRVKGLARQTNCDHDYVNNYVHHKLHARQHSRRATIHDGGTLIAPDVLPIYHCVTVLYAVHMYQLVLSLIAAYSSGYHSGC